MVSGAFRRSTIAGVALLGVAACGSDADRSDSIATDTTVTTTVTTTEASSVPPADDPTPSEQRFPDVVDATASFDGAAWTIAATLSSPYDSPERYADAWRVVGPDGTVYGERILTHDHANEQPFTRRQSGIEIPADVTQVTIEGRDQTHGWGGSTFTLDLVP